MKDLKVTLVRQSKRVNPKTNKKDRTRTVISDHIKQISFETKVKKGNEEMMMNNNPIKEENEFVFETKIFRQSEEGISSVTSYEEIIPIEEKEEDLFKTVIHGIFKPVTLEEKAEEIPLEEHIEYVELDGKTEKEVEPEEYLEEEYSKEEDEFEPDPEERDLEGYEEEEFEDEEEYDDEDSLEDYDDEYEDDERYLMDLVPENQKKRIKGSVDKITKRNLSEQF